MAWGDYELDEGAEYQRKLPQLGDDSEQLYQFNLAGMTAVVLSPRKRSASGWTIGKSLSTKLSSSFSR